MFKTLTTTLTFLFLIIAGNSYSQIEFDTKSSYFIEIPVDTTVILPTKKLEKIGGISGIDYDKRSDQYLLISDSGKKHGNGRYYTATIRFGEEITFEFLDVHYLANSELRGEGVRSIPKGMLLTDERTINETERSFIFQYGEDGTSMEIPLPAKFQKPMWDNSGFEGLAFSENENIMYIALERAMPDSHNRYVVSILRYDLSDLGKPPLEYYYPLQRKEEGNGISEIMTYNDSTLLVVERDWVSPNNYVSIFSVDLDDLDKDSVNNSKLISSVRPKKLFSFNDVTSLGGKKFKVSNIEGITMSPKKDYLILVSDNNFGNKCNCTPTQLVFLKIK